MKKLQLGKYGVAILLATIFLTLPPMAESRPRLEQGDSTQTLEFFVKAPEKGQPIQLPAGIPQECREAALKVLKEFPLGHRVLVAPAATSKYRPDLVEFYTKIIDYQNSLQSIPALGSCVGWILVIIVTVIAGVIIYTVYKICKKFEDRLRRQNDTNTPPVAVFLPFLPLKMLNNINRLSYS